MAKTGMFCQSSVGRTWTDRHRQSRHRRTTWCELSPPVTDCGILPAQSVSPGVGRLYPQGGPRQGRKNRLAPRSAGSRSYANRRRMKGARGKNLARWRAEKVERSMAHSYETGGLRRVHRRGHSNILKRVLVHAAALNLGLVMRKICGQGTPRGLQGRSRRFILALISAFWNRAMVFAASIVPWPRFIRSWSASLAPPETLIIRGKLAFTTGC